MTKPTKAQKKTTVVIKGKLPGEAVDRHLKTYGHLPNTKLCDDKGSCMPKLDKAQEKRFDEKFYKYGLFRFRDDKKANQYENIYKELKQHLASELATQKKEIIGKLEKMKVLSFKVNGQEGQMEKEIKYRINKALDQAIKSIK